MFVLACVGINCISMALYDPVTPALLSPLLIQSCVGSLIVKTRTPGTKCLSRSVSLSARMTPTNTGLTGAAMPEYVLIAIFSSEMVLKWIVYSISTYFSDKWNILDSLVVVTFWMSLIPGIVNFSAIGLLKAFRPLKAMGKSGGMRRIIDVMMLAAQSLVDVFFLWCLVFFIFGIVGTQLFQGRLTQHCFSTATGLLYTPEDENGFRTCGARFVCPSGYECMTGESGQYAKHGLGDTGNPNGGVTSFDDIGHAFLTIFVAITLEGWVDVMYLIQDSFSDSVSTIFFVLLIVLGSLFMLNLALAVVADEYEAQGEAEEEEEDSDVEQDKAVQDLADHTANFLANMAVSSWFNNSIFVFILFNTVVLACEHVRTRVVCPGSKWTTEYNGRAGEDGTCIDQAIGMDTTFSHALEILNYTFIAVFTIEMIIKVIGLGPKLYASDRFNLFDTAVVLISFVELGLSSNSSLSALRACRLGRVFKMAKCWDSLRAVIETIADTLPSVACLCILLCLFMFIAAVAGMQLFGGKLKSIRSNYDNFGFGMLTTFQILSGENWNEVLYDAINSTSYAAVVYFVLLVVIGNFLVLNLFLAILLSKFSTGAGPDITLDALMGAIKRFLPAAAISPPTEDKDQPLETNTPVEQHCGSESLTEPDAMVTPSLSLIKLFQIESDRRCEERKIKADAGWLGPSDPEKPLVVTGNAFFCLGPDNGVRMRFGKMIDSPLFQNFILLCIFVSSLLLAADEPGLDENSDFALFLKQTDWMFTILFALELMVKVVVYGLLLSPNAYLRDGWNLLDAFIVAISLFSLGFGGNGGSFKALRAFRTLKPLRSIKRAHGLKLVVDTILACMPAFLNISMVTVLFYLVFAIIGVQFWAGKFWICNDLSVDNVSQCVGTYTNVDGDAVVRIWSNAAMNFDDVGNAMLTLFSVASLELWLDVMYSAMDVPSDLGGQPELNQRAYFCLYFVTFVVLGSFLIMNLFVGAVVDNFNQVKAADANTGSLSQAQLDFMDSLDLMLSDKLYPKAVMPQGTSCIAGIRRVCFKICMWDHLTPHHTGASFDFVISILILTNVVVMSLYVWKAPDSLLAYDSDAVNESQESGYNGVLEVINNIFIWLFFLEFTCKLVGLGVYQYVHDNWNRLDGFVVIVSITGFVLQRALGSFTKIDPSIVRTLRAFRACCRLQRLLKGKFGRGVLALLETLVDSLPALANVSALLVLVIFIYACLGMAFFGNIDTDESRAQSNGMPYKLYNEHCNFQTFYRSVLLLFRMSTGESWNGLMYDVVHVYPQAWLYFVSYMIIVAYLLFNLLIAIVLEKFAAKMHQQQLTVNRSHIASFVEHWLYFDPDCTHFISVEDVVVLLQVLEPPLGFATGVSRVDVFRDDLYMPNYQGQVHFVEFLLALVKFAYGTTQIDCLQCSRLTEIAMQIGYAFPSLVGVCDDGGFSELYARMDYVYDVNAMWCDRVGRVGEGTANADAGVDTDRSWFQDKFNSEDAPCEAQKADQGGTAPEAELTDCSDQADVTYISGNTDSDLSIRAGQYM